MSEFTPDEDRERFDILRTPEHKALPTHEQATPDPVESPRQRLETAREAIEQAPDQENPLEGLEAAETPPQTHGQGSYVSPDLKAATLNRELRHIRHKQSLPQRSLSRVVHQPLVRAVSTAAGATVSRPSGLLGGGLVAFLGTSGYLFFANHIGLTYNYLVFLLLFVGGFTLGLILELGVHLATAAHRER